jgi:tetratricopeptide (TPR) repeat protein
LPTFDCNRKKFEEAKIFYHKALDLDAKDPEVYYSVGVIDWTEAYSRRTREYSKLKMKTDEPFINRAECWSVREDNEAVVQDGMENMAKALEFRRDYDDAMAYMNLLYRERGNIQCGDSSKYYDDMNDADHWVGVTINTKKTKAAKLLSKKPPV